MFVFETDESVLDFSFFFFESCCLEGRRQNFVGTCPLRLYLYLKDGGKKLILRNFGKPQPYSTETEPNHEMNRTYF